MNDLIGFSDDVYNELADNHLHLLNPRERKFVLCFTGDPVKAAEIAGYSHPGVNACRLMNRKKVTDALKLVQGKVDSAHIASAEEVLMYWTEVKRDTGADTKDRIACSKLLGQYRGLLSEKLLISKTSVNIDLKAELGDLLPHEVKLLEKHQQDVIDIEAEPINPIDSIL